MSYCSDKYGSLSIPKMLDMIEGRDKAIAKLDSIIEELRENAHSESNYKPAPDHIEYQGLDEET